MDTTDPNIEFNLAGLCSHCINFDERISKEWSPQGSRFEEILPRIQRIRKQGRDLPYDCIIGISGGLDSSYVAYVAKEVFELRPLLFHVDAGWNTKHAVENVGKIVSGLKLDLYTEVINWEEMRDLQVAFLRSQVADQDLPQDLAFFSSLYKFAVENGYKYIITGGNFSTECIREPMAWGAYYGTDTVYVKDIHSRFGSIPLSTFPRVDILKYKIYDKFVHGLEVVKLLDYVQFTKKDAEALLNTKFGWKPFQHKHHESIFTRFYESFWLPRKFGFDKRRAHFSSLILTGQMKRVDALMRLETPELDDAALFREFDYVAKKLGLTPQGLREIFEKRPNLDYSDYKNNLWLISFGTKLMQMVGVEKRRFQ